MNSPAPPAPTVNPAKITSFTNNEDGSASLSTALAETVAGLACYRSSVRPAGGGDAAAGAARKNNNGSQLSCNVSNGGNSAAGNQSVLLVNGQSKGDGGAGLQPQQNPKQAQPQKNQHTILPLKQPQNIQQQGGFVQSNRVTSDSIDNRKKQKLSAESFAYRPGGNAQTVAQNKQLSAQARPVPSAAHAKVQQPLNQMQSTTPKTTIFKAIPSVIQNPVKNASPTRNQAQPNKSAESAPKDSLSHTIASLATLSNFATPNRKPVPAASSAPTASSRPQQERHQRSLSGPIISGTAFSAVVAMQNRGLGSDASVGSSSGKKCATAIQSVKSVKKEGAPGERTVPPSSTGKVQQQETTNPSAVLEQIAMISNSIAKPSSNIAKASTPKVESKKRPSLFPKNVTAANFPKKTLTRCSDGAPIIAGTAAAAMAIATAARIATSNNDTAKKLHGFGVVEDDATLDRVVSLSTKAVLGIICGEDNASVLGKEKCRTTARTPQVSADSVTRVTPEEEQLKDMEATSSSSAGYRIVSSQSSQPLHQNSTSTLSSQPASFLSSANNTSGSTGMDILADIICHVPPMAVPKAPSTSTSSPYSHLSHPPPQHHDWHAHPSYHQEVYQDRQNIHHPQHLQQHRPQPQPSGNVPAIPSYQEIYQEMGIAPRNYHGHDQHTVYQYHRTAEALADCHNHSQYSYPPPNCAVETTMSSKSTESNAQSQSRSLSTHYGHAISGEIEEGKELYTRKDLMLMGGHLQEHKDVHGSMKEGADSVVLCNLEREIREGDGLCWFLFSCDRTNGGGALCRSYHKKRAIRVFRSSVLGGRYAPPYLDEEEEDDDIGYRYDGLYMVRAVWDINGNETESFPCTGDDGWQTYFFTRLPKKPLDGRTEPGMQYNAMGLQELWGTIQKMKGVRKPKKFEIPQAPMKLPPLKRGAISGDNKDRKATSYRPETQVKDSSPDGKVNRRKLAEDTSIDSSDEDSAKQPPLKRQQSAETKLKPPNSPRREKSAQVLPRPLPNKVVTPRPRMSGSSPELKKIISPTTSSQSKRQAPVESSDSSDSETEASTVTPKKTQPEPPRLNSLSPTKRPNNLAQVISTLLPKRATAAKAEAANRDMLAKKTKRPYNRKFTSASSPPKKRAKRKAKKDDESSSSSIDGVDPNVLTVGSRVLVLYKGSLFKATVRKRREKNGKHDFQIHYDGNKKSNVHWVPTDRIQQILFVAIDTTAAKKPDGNKGKRGGWNKKSPKRSQSVDEESDHSDDEEADIEELNDSKPDESFGLTMEQGEEVLQSEPDVAESEQKKEQDSESKETAELGTDPSSAEAPAENSEVNDLAPPGDSKNDPGLVDNECVEAEDKPAVQKSKFSESSASGSKSNSKRKRVTVFDDVEVAPANVTPSQQATNSFDAKKKSLLDKSSTLSTYDDDASSFDVDDGSGKEGDGNSSEQEDATLEQKAGDPTSEVKFPLGSHVYVEYRKIFYSSTVLQTRRKRNSTEYLVHYEGYKKASDRWVKESGLHEVNAETTKRFEEQRLVSSNIAFEPDSSGPSDFSMTTRRKTDESDSQGHHPRRQRSDTSDMSVLGDIGPGVAFLPGSMVFVEWSGALYLAKMVKKRFAGERTEYLVSYDGFDSDHDAWISIHCIYEVNPQTKRVFNRMNADIKSGAKPKKPDPPKTKAPPNKKRESSPTRSTTAKAKKAEPKKEKEKVLTFSDPPLPRRRDTRKKQDDDSAGTSCQASKPSSTAATDHSTYPPIDMQGIPSGVEFLPGSTLFAARKGCLFLAKMLKKRGKGEDQEYFIHFNDGKDDSESFWISIAHVYEINPQTKRVFRQLSKQG